LEEEGLVVRHVVTERPVRTEYMLSRKGSELGRALSAVERWADKWL